MSAQFDSRTATQENLNAIASKYAEMIQNKQIDQPSWLREPVFDESSKKIDGYIPNVESTRTIVFYLMNLVCMILMCILIVGILIISLIIYLEGSLSVDPQIFIHMTMPSFVLALNLFVIMLDDTEEEKFFKNHKKTGSGRGIFLVNFSLIGTVLALSLTAYLKFVVGKSNNNQAPFDAELDEDEEGGLLGQSPQVVFIEECLMHALGVV